jgi:hypothetical protein
MRRRFLTAPFVLVMTAAGCGSAGSSSTPAGAPATQPPGGLHFSHPGSLVLDSDELGAGMWLVIDKQTRPVSLEQSMKEDPASIRPLERKAYRAGYQALYSNSGRLGLFAGVFTYDTGRNAGRIARVWATMTARRMHGRRLAAPPGAPGHSFTLWRGHVAANGTQLPAYFAQWVRGNAIVSMLSFGRSATAHDLMELVLQQDRKLTAAG